jgi:hypothetical protein
MSRNLWNPWERDIQNRIKSELLKSQTFHKVVGMSLNRKFYTEFVKELKIGFLKLFGK